MAGEGEAAMDQQLVDRLVEEEWEFFQKVKGENGRASCQDDWRTFKVMRSSQALAWSDEIVRSLLDDLAQCRAQGRNPMMEKYARMMEFTEPEEYEKLKPLLPPVEEGARALARHLTERMVKWVEEAREEYPYVCGAGRPLHSNEDSDKDTSLETYDYCELQTYSPRTLELIAERYDEADAAGENLYLTTQENTARQQGYGSLAEAERVLAYSTRCCYHNDPLGQRM